MVVFTCNNCGDSLQKPKVEKHYATACRTLKNLTCVDCLKDFREEEYAAHNKCITEQERYSAKGTVTNVVGKGEAKQQVWTDMIEEIIQNHSNAKGSQKVIFEIMSNQTANVPRKKMKFLNFIKNAGGNRIMYPDIEKVWDIIEQHKGVKDTSDNKKESEVEDSQTKECDTETKTENSKKKEKAKKKKKLETDADETEPSNVEAESQEPPKKKKRKSKNKEADVAVDNKPSEEEQIQENNSEKQNGEKKGKSKKRKSDINVENNEISNGMDITELQSEVQENGIKSAEKKKKKRKSENEHENLPNGIANEVNVTDEITETKSKKKKLNDTSITDQNGHQNRDLDESIPKEKKKKKKSETSEEVNDNCSNNTKGENKESSTVEDGSSEDALIRIVLKVLQKKESLPLTKLQKKVISEYCKETGIAENSKLIKKFNKQLKKIKGVEILNDNVKLKKLGEC